MPISIAPPSTDVEIIKAACSLCGQGSFNSVSAGGAFAEDANFFYGTIVTAELGSNRWRFAQDFQAMGTLSTLTPSFDGWLYYWDMPADLLMFQYVYPDVNYIVFGERVLTKTNQNLTAIYAKAVPVSKWPPAFSMYIVYALAEMLAMSVTDSDNMLARIINGKEKWESRALFADSQNSPARTLRSNPWVETRFNFRSNSNRGWYR